MEVLQSPETVNPVLEKWFLTDIAVCRAVASGTLKPLTWWYCHLLKCYMC